MFAASNPEPLLMVKILLLPGPGSAFRKLGHRPAGFFAGIWHGIIVAITFLISVVNVDIRIYETKNEGVLYDCGFLLGLAILYNIIINIYN